MEYKIGEHTLNFEWSGSGSIDPWSGAYAREIGVTQWGTSDIGNFVLVDGDGVYRLRSSLVRFNDFWEKSDKTWETALKWVEDNKERYFGSLEEIKKDLDERKRKEDEYNAMTKEEKEEHMRKWREERKKRLDKIMEEKQGK